jgi:hypothetical protein
VEADYTPGNPGGDLEVSVMLDVTGSMCNDGEGPCTTSTKLTGLKQAANKLVDTVVWDDQSTYTSRIAIVPFSTRVRVGQDGAGTSAMATMAGMPAGWTDGTRCASMPRAPVPAKPAATGPATRRRCRNTPTESDALRPDRFYNSSGKFDSPMMLRAGQIPQRP